MMREVFIILDSGIEPRFARRPRCLVESGLGLSASGHLRAYLSCQRSQSSEPQQVVGSTDQVGMQLHAAKAACEGATQPAVGFHPAEDLFDPFALALAHRIAGMTGRAPVQA